MEFVYPITAAQQKAIYIYGYFNRPWYWFQRRFAGPFLVLVGVLLLVLPGRETTSSSWLLNMMFITFGFYYIIRPWISAARLKFADMTVKFTIENGQLVIENQLGKSVFRKEEILSVTEKKGVLTLKVKQVAVYYFMFKLEYFGAQAADFAREVKLLAPSARA